MPVLNVKMLIHRNTPFWNAPQVLSSIKKYYLGSMHCKNTQINLSKEQFLFQNYTLSPAVHRSIHRRLDLSVLFMKKYLYACKMTESQPSYLQFLNNQKLQWKSEH